MLYNIGGRSSSLDLVPFHTSCPISPSQFMTRTLKENKRKQRHTLCLCQLVQISPPTSVAGVLMPILGGMLDDLLFLA